MTTSADVVTEERLAELIAWFSGEFFPTKISPSYQEMWFKRSEVAELKAALSDYATIRRQLREAGDALEAGERLCFALPGRDKSMALYSDYAASLRALAAKGKGV